MPETNSKIVEQQMMKLRQQVASLPPIIGNEVKNFALDSFKKQGFLGETFEPWKKRKSKKQGSRAILVKTGRLRRGWRVAQANWDRVILANDVPYAKAHNDGVHEKSVDVKAHSRNKFSRSKVGSGRFTKSGKERMKTVQSISGSSQVKAHTRRMSIPRRRMIGNSPYLMNKLRRTAVAHILKAYK
jgi:hypothetical protein